MSDQSMAYVGRATCGCIRAVSVDAPEATDLTARDVARMVKTGLTVERMSVADVRATKLTRPDCAVHAISRPAERQEALL